MTNIVMLARDRYKLLEQTLHSLYSHTDHSAFTLTVVEDDSDDFRVPRLLAKYAAEHSNIRIVNVLNSTHVLAQLKNLGVAASYEFFGEGDWLYLSDSDVYFTPHWLEKLIAKAEVTEPESFRLWGGQIHPFHQPAKDGEYEVLDGPSWLLRWQTWRDFGGLQRTCAPGPCQSEEYPFCTELCNAGYRIGVLSPHVVIHTGLTNTNGSLAPGSDQRRALIPQGVICG